MFMITGDYVEHKSDSASRSVYYTFTPRPLMEGSFYLLDDELSHLLVAAHRTLGMLEGMSLYLADKEILQELLLLKESYYSRRIDYSDSDPDFYSLLVDRGTGEDIYNMKNIASAYLHAFEKKSGLANLNDIYNLALHGSNLKQKVYIRTKPFFMTNATTNFRQYNPAAPENIRPAMNDITRFLDNDPSDVLIKSALIHYQFEMIHPYECYNGIIGRLLIFKLLHDAGLEEVRYLSLSEFFYNNRSEYMGKLTSTQKSGDYLLWIKFILHAIHQAAQQSIEQVKNYEQTVRRDEAKIIACRATNTNTLEVYYYFKKNLISGIKQLSEHLQMAYNTVAKSISVLQSMGILTQISVGSRNRIFAYSELSKIFLDI